MTTINKFKYPNYSLEDLKFKLTRDVFLKKKEYEKIMQTMMKEKKFIPENYYKKLFFSEKDLLTLNKLGHLIGLHSHNHPTILQELNYEDKLK